MQYYKFDLCFCIPTYNRSLKVKALVESILSHESKRISVVVLDNGSIDDTFEQLLMINDVRLTIKRNGENKGALYNMIHVLDNSNGKYSIYCTDQDLVNIDFIEDFLDKITSYDGILAGGYCLFSYDNLLLNESINFSKGYDALKCLGYLGRHPSGYFFNTEILKKVKIVENYSDYDRVDLFPLEFAFADISLEGDALIYNKSLLNPEISNSIAKNKSSTTDGKTNKSFFHPVSRLKLASSYCCHAAGLPLINKNKVSIISCIFIRGLIDSTVGFRHIMKDKNICDHYYMLSRNVRFYELLFISIKYSFNFYFNVRCALKENDVKITSLFLCVLKKIIKWNFSLQKG